VTEEDQQLENSIKEVANQFSLNVQIWNCCDGIKQIKQTRESWNLNLNQKVTEVQVQFANENPTWIPIETLLAIQTLTHKNNV